MRHVDMHRSKLAIVALCIGGAVAVSPSARAVTLGNVVSQSSLGQPLRLVIPVVLNHGENITAGCLRLVSDAAPGEMPQLVTGKVSFEPGALSGRLVVTTSRPVNEPALRVSLQTGCGDTNRRDYVLLFDPPLVDQNTAPPMLASDLPATSPVDVATLPPASPVRPAVHIASVRHDAAVPIPAATSRTAALTLVAASQREMAPTAPTMVEMTPTRTASAPPAAPQRDMIKLVASGNTSGGFISTANAQSLPLIGTSRPAQASSAPALERLWPYCAMALCLGGLAMCVAVMRRQRSQRAPAWLATSAHTFSKVSEHGNASQNTFAHYTEMTEPVPAASAVIRNGAAKAEVRREPTPTTGELDTLLNNDLIDEEAIRKEWAAAASEHAVDIGTDSILKAIATAEREMRIGSPPPAQVAIDKSLDDELLSTPKKR